MERKLALNGDRSPPDISSLETQDLMASEKIMFTQDLDNTQLVEPTQEWSKDCTISQIGGDTHNYDDSLDQSLKDYSNISKDSVNPLKDLSNLPKIPTVAKTKTTNNSDSTGDINFPVQYTEDIPNTEEFVETPERILTCGETDLTPEIPGIERAAPDSKSAGSKEKVGIVGGNVPLSQSSVSSINPESTPSSQPSSSQLSSSDLGSCGDDSRLTHLKPQTPSDSGEILDITQDLFLSEETGVGETASQNASPLSVKSEIAETRSRDRDRGRDRGRDGNKAAFKEVHSRAPQQTPSPISVGVDAVKPRLHRTSGGNLFKQRVMNELAKESPPLDSQAVTLMMTEGGSGSGSDIGIVGQNTECFLALKTPETPKKQVYLATLERESSLCRETVEMVKNLLVTSTSLVDCKIIADRKSGEVISLQIMHVENLCTKAKQCEEPSMFSTSASPVNAELSRQSGSLGGKCCRASKNESWKAKMVDCFQEALKCTLTSSFKKATQLNSANERESLELRVRGAPTTPSTTVTTVTTSRKRKLSSSASPSRGAVTVGTKQITKLSPSPFKRPRIGRLRNGAREKIESPNNRHISSLHPSPASSELNLGNSLPKGAKVFGQWIDKKYYPGVVLKKSGADQHLVKFHDGKEKDLPLNKICVVSTFEINEPVLAFSAGFYKNGLVAEVKAFDYMDDKYVIKLDDGSLRELCREELSLTEQMVQNHRSKFSGADNTRRESAVDICNVVHGKRTRSTISPGPVPGPSGSKPKLAFSESSSCEEMERTNRSVRITGIEDEQNNVDPLAGKGPRKTKGRRKSVAPDDERLLNEYGPIPDEGCELFSGLSFILTCAMNHDHVTKQRRRNSSPSNESSDLSDNDCFCGPFSKIKKTMSKSRLAEQLIAGGGKILTSLDGLDAETELEDVFVITNRPCLTAAYIHCLALGIKGVLFDAIIHCCKKEIKFKEYIEKFKLYLDVGYSLKERRLISWNEIKDKARKPFRDVNIHVYSRDRLFTAYWKNILTCAGATPIDKTMVEFCTVIVAEPPVPDLLRKRATEFVIPIVSTDWIVQSLIHKEALPVHWHPDFKVGSEDSD